MERSKLVCVCVSVYPICIRHKETLRHPWASRRIVVYQVGVSSLKQNKEMVIYERLYQLSYTVILSAY